LQRKRQRLDYRRWALPCHPTVRETRGEGGPEGGRQHRRGLFRVPHDRSRGHWPPRGVWRRCPPLAPCRPLGLIRVRRSFKLTRFSTCSLKSILRLSHLRSISKTTARAATTFPTRDIATFRALCPSISSIWRTCRPVPLRRFRGSTEAILQATT